MVIRFPIRVVNDVIDLVYPRVCSFCAQNLSTKVSTIRLCESCQSSFQRDQREACRTCGYPVGPYVSTDEGCHNCKRRHFRFKRILRLGVYDDELRQACIRGKSVRAEPLSMALAHLLFERHQSTLAELDLDIVVPVPQFWLHRITRPHHQANTIAETLAARLCRPMHLHGLRKIRLTKDQSSLQRAHRIQNLQGAFRASNRIDWKQKNVLLVDDISTTATTANECARTLRQAGAAGVYVAVVAVVEASQ